MLNTYQTICTVAITEEQLAELRARPKVDPLSVDTIVVHVRINVIAADWIPGDNVAVTASLLPGRAAKHPDIL